MEEKINNEMDARVTVTEGNLREIVVLGFGYFVWGLGLGIRDLGLGI